MKNFAVAICAPSGVGKTTVARALVEQSPDLAFSVSATTRSARPGERPGVDYHFVARSEFESMIEQGLLLEWAEVHGELYGTPEANLEAAERDGEQLILDIDVQGAAQMVAACPDTVTIFLLPPSFGVLMERLRGRGSEDASRLRRRMETARSELEAMSAFQYMVVNDRLEEAVGRIRSIIVAEGQKSSRSGQDLEELRQRLLQALANEDV